MSLPRQLRAHRARPLPWLVAGTGVAALLLVVGLHAAADDRAWVDRALRVEAEVGAGYRGGGEIPVVYRHPVTDQEIEVTVSPFSSGFGSDPGDARALDVDPDDPERVALAGDRVPWVEVGYIAPWIVVPLLAYLGRRWTVRRTLRFVGDDSTAFAMLGAIAPRSPFRGRRPVLHLYALDAGPGAPSLCSVRVAATAGGPVAGPAFPVEVKGVPRPLGRVAARARAGAEGGEGGVLWPTGRAAPHGPWPRPDRVVDVVPPTPVDRPPPPGGGGRAPLVVRWRGAAEALVIPLGVFGATVALGAVVTAFTLTSAAAYDVAVEWEDTVGEVVDRDPGAYTVAVEYEQDGARHRATVPVEFADDYTVGRRYPIEVDPDDPEHVRVTREVYDAAEPIVTGWLPAAVAGGVLVAHLRRWRRVRALDRTGPWWRTEAWSQPGGQGLVGDRAEGYVRASLPRARPVRSSWPLAAVVAGCPEPGEVVMVVDEAGDRYPVVRPLGVPDRAVVGIADGPGPVVATARG